MRSLTNWFRSRWPIIALGLTMGGGVAIGGVLLGLLPYGAPAGPFEAMGDATAYWRGARAEHLYDWQIGYAQYRYSPAFLWVIAPISWLPWEAFAAVWLGLHLAVIAWFRAPWLLAFPPVADDIIRGNISLFLAAMIVLGLRYPGAWAFGILTKVTPGIGVLWHMVRREWRPAGLALAATGVIAAAGFALQPDLWLAWGQSLAAGAGGVHGVNVVISLPIRLVAAGVIIVAFRHRPRWLPVAVTVAMPTLWLSSLAVLAAIVPLSDREFPIAGRHRSIQMT